MFNKIKQYILKVYIAFILEGFRIWRNVLQDIYFSEQISRFSKVFQFTLRLLSLYHFEHQALTLELQMTY